MFNGKSLEKIIRLDEELEDVQAYLEQRIILMKPNENEMKRHITIGDKVFLIKNECNKKRFANSLKAKNV